MKLIRLGSSNFFYNRDKNGYSVFLFDGLYKFKKQVFNFNQLREYIRGYYAN